MALYYCDGKRLKFAISGGAHWLTHNKEILNSLNVFPIPDGDTGTNMSLTLQKVLEAFENSDNDFLPDVARIMAHNSLLGARGSSGVILSQILHGFAESIGDKHRISSTDIAGALKASTERAYSAIDKPAEGTILTLLRETADSSAKIANTERDIIKLLYHILETGEEILIKSRDLLPELRDAKVIDAGGQGFLFMIEGMLRAIEGKPIHQIQDTREKMQDINFKIQDSEKQKLKDRGIEDRYCMDFLLMGNIDEETKKKLRSFGSEVIISSDIDITKIHIHTNTPENVLNFVKQYGKIEEFKIEDMEEQRSGFVASGGEMNTPIKNNIGIVSVVLGEGFKEIFKKSGALIVEGGQTMNPSVDEIKSEIDSVNAETVFVLPNNSNIIATAKQAGELSSTGNKKIYVLPTKTVPEGISAMTAFSNENSTEENLNRMNSAIPLVKSGEATKAVKDSINNGIRIKEGDYIGIYNDSIVASNQNRTLALEGLLKKMIDKNDSVVSIFYQSDEEIEHLSARFVHLFSNMDIEFYFGGQPHYDFIVSVE